MNDKREGGVIGLVVENYVGAKELRVSLYTGNNIIGGPNGAGKSSGINAVSNIFGGKKLTPPMPLHDGEDAFKLKATLNDLGLVVTRSGKMSKNGILNESVTVVSAEGDKKERPQEILDDLLGGHSVALESLSEMPQKKQIELLRQMTGLDFTELDKERALRYQQRTLANGEIKAFEARIKASTPHEGVPDVPIVIVDLMEELRVLRSTAQKNDEERSCLEESTSAVSLICAKQDAISVEIDRLKKEEAELNDQLTEAIEVKDRLAEEVEALVDPDIEEAEQRISGVDDINEKVRENLLRAELVTSLEDVKETKATLDSLIDSIDAVKKGQLESAILPVAGMSFDDDGVYIGGIPLEQCSHGEQMDVDVAVVLARNPEVPIILIHQGSLYDMEHLDALDKIAKDQGIYVVLEMVMNSIEDANRVGAIVYMEDGVGLLPGSAEWKKAERTEKERAQEEDAKNDDSAPEAKGPFDD